MPDDAMPASATGPHTPGLEGQHALGALDTRYVDVDALPWIASPYEGIDIKILFKDEARGLMTALFRWQPGSRLPMHEHTDIEQSFVLEGSLCDDQGECRAGQFAWRPAGSTHDAWSPGGCLILATFQKPNRFLDGPEAA